MPGYTVEIHRIEKFKLEADSEEQAEDLAREWSTLEDRMQDTDFGDAPISDHSHDITEIKAQLVEGEFYRQEGRINVPKGAGICPRCKETILEDDWVQHIKDAVTVGACPLVD